MYVVRLSHTGVAAENVTTDGALVSIGLANKVNLVQPRRRRTRRRCDALTCSS